MHMHFCLIRFVQAKMKKSFCVPYEKEKVYNEVVFLKLKKRFSASENLTLLVCPHPRRVVV